MAWGALVKGVTTGAAKKAATGAAKKAATGAIKKKVKGKGKKIAEKMMEAKKEKDDSSSITVRKKSTILSGPLLGGDGGGQDSSTQQSSGGKSKSPLDRIDSALKDIMKTLKKRRKLMLNKSRKMRVQDDKEKKGKREGLLEKMKTTGKNMAKSAVDGAKGWWERLQKFLLMTFLGALVVAIKENWEKIKEKIDKVVNVVKDIWKFMEPVITPLIEGLKWVVAQWTEMGSELMKSSKDNKEIGKETDKLAEDLNKLKSAGEGVEKEFGKAVDGVKDYERKEFADIAKEGGLDTNVSPDDDKESSEDGKGEGKVIEKIDGSDIKTKLDDFKSNLEEVKSAEIKVDPEKLKQYEEGAVPVPETGPAIVHKGEVIIPAPIVKKIGGPMNVVNLMEMGELPGLGGGGGGTNAITDKATNKSLGKRGKDIGNLLALPFRDRTTEVDPRSKFASLSEHLPPVMVEKMEKTLTTIKEQTDYEDPSGSTIIIRVPTSTPQSGGGGGGKTIAVPVGPTPKDTLNRYVNAVIQKALF